MKIICFAFIFSTQVFSETLHLRGVVHSSMKINVIQEGSAKNLNLSKEQKDLKIATITESSNPNSRYKVSVTSVNKGKFESEMMKNSSHDYIVKYKGEEMNLSSPREIIITASDDHSDLTISYKSFNNIMNAPYSDTIRLTYKID